MSEKVTEINKPEGNEMKLKLSKEYDFEGQKIGEIDLSGLDNLTAADMIQANKVLTNNGTVSVLPETTLEYDLIIAAGGRHGAQEQSDIFFIRRGINPADFSELRKCCLTLSLNLSTGLDYFLQMNIFDLIDLCADLKEVTPKK